MNNTKDTDRRRLSVRIFAFLAIVSFDIIIGRNSNYYTTTTLFDDGHNAYSPKNITNNYIHTINNNSNDYQDRNNDTIRISFQLHDPTIVPFTDLFSGNYGCKVGPLRTGGVRTGELPPSLLLGGQDINGHVHGRVLDFTTTISNSLNILHIGDSVTIQIAQALDEMMGGTEQTRTNLWEAYKGGEGGTIVAPTRGGGINGAWRITALLSEAARGLPETKNKVGGGWNYHQSNYFLNHEYATNNDGGDITTVKKLDAVIFRVMHGWMSVEEITRERIIEAAMLANSILGAETIIFITVPFTNNVKDAHMYEGVSKVNEMIWDVAENWYHDHPESIVLVMDYAAYSNHIIWANARHIGYNVSDPLTVVDSKVFDSEGPKFILERLNQNVWPPSIPQVCSKKPTSESDGAYCERNILFNDGMHMCTETMSARVGAAVACLLGCVYNRKGQSSSSLVDSSLERMQKESVATTKLKTRIMKIRACERQCNSQFMSVLPVKENWINTTLASFAD